MDTTGFFASALINASFKRSALAMLPFRTNGLLMIDIEKLQSELDYDPITGTFRWKVSKPSIMKVRHVTEIILTGDRDEFTLNLKLLDIHAS